MMSSLQDSTSVSRSSPRFRIGVDVGGTNTDSVVVKVTDSSRPTTSEESNSSPVVASFKHATTPDVTTGIEIAVKRVLEIAGLSGYDLIDNKGILSLTIGTTHFVNAVVQSDATKLSKVAVIRIAAPYTTECPPFIDFPKNLERLMNGHTAVIRGGLQIDGRVINELDESELLAEASQIRLKGLKDIVLISVYSPLDTEGKFEYRARDILRRELGTGYNIICSRDVGQVGFLERENASILNSSITSFAQRTIRSFKLAMKRLGLSCPLYLTQNDGTLITADEASRLPIKTFSSGATNSMRGASFLAGIKGDTGGKKSVIVVDIGGTTTDVGVLLPSGFPRHAAAFVQIAGVRTNFSMPDVYSIGLGGGSVVRKQSQGRITVGPDSVGNNLLSDSKVFGGTVLTTTDVTVRSRRACIGDPDLVSDIEEAFVTEVQGVTRRILEGVIDRMKTSADECDLLLVGGGSIIAPDSLKGIGRIITPPFHEVANAVGAAIASVSGTVDTIEILHGKDVASAIEDVKNRAIAKAIAAGATPDSVQIVEVNVLPIQYVTNQATRIIVRAVGELGFGEADVVLDEDMLDDTADECQPAQSVPGDSFQAEDVEEYIDYATYKPTVKDNEWILSETDLFFIMEGCGVLGTGGGGSPYPSYLICRQMLRDGGSIRVVDHTFLPEDAMVVRGGFMGSPSVVSERVRGTSHLQLAGNELAKYCGIKEFAATLCDEIGGGNGLQSLAMSQYYNIPALDGDLMGRAYPKLNQVLPAVYGRPNALVPCSLHDGDDNVVILTRVKNEHFVETIMRVVTTEMGSAAALCPPPLAVRDARDYGVMHSQSQAWRIGRAIAICRQTSKLNQLADAILELQNGKCLFVGKIVDVSREVRAGFTWGQVRISPLSDEELEDRANENPARQRVEYEAGTTVVIPFQNENLCVYLETGVGDRTVLASVPDLITILDSQSGSHLGTPEYAYGLRVTVVALAGHPLWRTTMGLEVGGPAAFGLTNEYFPTGDYLEPTSVIAEYGSR